MPGRYDLALLLEELGDIGGPIPSDGASDAAWTTWADAQELEAALIGLASRPLHRGDSKHLLRIRQLLAEPGLRDLLGARLESAERVVVLLDARLGHH